jgi:gas vesicle protein
MRFVLVLILGIALGATIGLVAAPQPGSETVRVVRERVQQWRGKADSDEGEPTEA